MINDMTLAYTCFVRPWGRGTFDPGSAGKQISAQHKEGELSECIYTILINAFF